MNSLSLREKVGLLTFYYTSKVKKVFRDVGLTNPKAWNPALWNLYGSNQTESGVNITEETALNYSACFAAVRIISETVATLPIHLYKRTPKNARKPITDHPSLMRLKHRANPMIPGINFREAMTAHILSWGNGYAEIVRNKIGDIVELWPITPDRVTPIWRSGEVQYRVKVDGEEILFPRAAMLHIAGLGYDGMIGYSVIRKASESIGLGIGAERFGGRFFGSNTNVGGVITYPRALGPDTRDDLKRSLKDYTGSDKSHRWMVLEQGMEVEKLGFSPEDSQFLQTRQFQVSDIARWFNIPPHKLKDLTRSTFSNIEEQEIEFVTGCIRPWLERIEQNYNIQLLTEKENKLGYYFKHSVEGILRGSSNARGEFYTKQFYLGALTPNEIRALEDREPLEEENADKAYLQMNLTPLEDIGKEPEPSPFMQPAAGGGNGDDDAQVVEGQVEENNLEWSKRNVMRIEYRSIAARDKISKRYYPLIKDAAGAVIYREEVMLTRLIKKHASRRTIGTLKEEIEKHYNSFEKHVAKKMAPAFQAYGDSVYNQGLMEINETVEEIPDEVQTELVRFTNTYAKRHVNSSRGQILQLLDQFAEDYEMPIAERLEEWKEKRPDKIASNETVRLGNFAVQVAFFSFGYKSFWRIRGAQTCPYCQALNGRAIRQGGNFFGGGEEFEPKGAKNGPMLIRSTVKHPPLHQGCDCYISAG